MVSWHWQLSADSNGNERQLQWRKLALMKAASAASACGWRTESSKAEKISTANGYRLKAAKMATAENGNNQ